MTRASLLALAAIATAPFVVFGCQAIVGIHHDVELVDGGAEAGAEDGADDANETSTDTADAPAVDGDGGGRCPSGRGPEMVLVTKSGGSFCIDTTEVTEEQWRAFDVAVKPTPPARCGGITAKPIESWMNSGPNKPRAYVNWCQAWQFCAWAGKRLCGNESGAPAKVGEPTEWEYACKQGAAATPYPYGATFDIKACNGAPADCDASSPMLADVAATKTCRGTTTPYSSVYDLVGNVAEYIDECDDSVEGGPPECAVRGGGVYDCMPDGLSCVGANSLPIDTQSDSIGFRCCATPLGL